MKTRRHHNNKGYRQIKRGKTVEQVKSIARKLNLKYAETDFGNETISTTSQTANEGS